MKTPQQIQGREEDTVGVKRGRRANLESSIHKTGVSEIP